MPAPAYNFRTLGARALGLPLAALFAVFLGGIVLDKAAMGWLAGMSCAVIIIVAQAFADASREPRYWYALGLFVLLHMGILAFSSERWIPKPTQAITPVFLLDYLLMGFAFPRLTGLKFAGL